MSHHKQKYPWIRLLNLYTGKLYEKRDVVDEIKDFAPGWVLAFGDIMCQELDGVIKAAGVEDSFVFHQVKEKLGSLRLRHNQPKNSEIDLICRRYELISRNVCLRCGRIDVPVVCAPWIRPMCEDCYIKTERVDPEKSDYAELTANSPSAIPTIMAWEEFERCDAETNTTHYKKFEVDISDSVKKIRKRWEERVSNGTHIIEESKLDSAYTLEEVMASIEEDLDKESDNDA